MCERACGSPWLTAIHVVGQKEQGRSCCSGGQKVYDLSSHICLSLSIYGLLGVCLMQLSEAEVILSAACLTDWLTDWMDGWMDGWIQLLNACCSLLATSQSYVQLPVPANESQHLPRRVTPSRQWPTNKQRSPVGISCRKLPHDGHWHTLHVR